MTAAFVTNIPVYNFTTVGLTKNDKIALGVGVGLGAPLFLSLLVFCCMRTYPPDTSRNQAGNPWRTDVVGEQSGYDQGNNAAG
jgi:hypothetical protein